MPRHFFHVQDGRYMPDIEGTELADAEAAREEAVRLAGSLLKEHGKEFWSGESWSLEVHDAADRPLFTLMFPAKADAQGPLLAAHRPPERTFV